jgi:hypothetical protein
MGLFSAHLGQVEQKFGPLDHFSGRLVLLDQGASGTDIDAFAAGGTGL